MDGPLGDAKWPPNVEYEGTTSHVIVERQPYVSDDLFCLSLMSILTLSLTTLNLTLN